MKSVNNKYTTKEKRSSWVKVDQGYIKVGHKLGGKSLLIQTLIKQGTTTVFTILGKNEGAEKLGTEILEAGIDWVWLELPNANPPSKQKDSMLLEKLNVIKNKLVSGEKVYIHCSAGLHRTGMISFALLRLCNYNWSDALNKLNESRPATVNEMTAERLQWVDKFIERLQCCD